MFGWMTTTGRLVAVLGIGAFVGGWRLGWLELFVFSAGCGILLLFGIPFVVGRANIGLDRNLQPDRVEVATPAIAELIVSNRTSRPTRPRVIVESIGSKQLDVPVPSLRGHEEQTFIVNLPTKRRGVVDIGPARISMADPLGLFHRSLGQTGVNRLWVHPRTRLLKPLATGFAKDLEGPTHDTSPAGDVAFHTIRQYQPGDDHRHVHWMSTARKGELMVRHYVDNRRPEILVVVDNSESAMSVDELDLGLEVGTSLAVSAFAESQPCALYVGSEAVLGSNNPGTAGDLLDRVCTITGTADDDLHGSLLRATSVEKSASLLVMVSAQRTAEDLVRLVDPYTRKMKVVVVLVGDDAPQTTVPRTRTVHARTLDDFVHKWRVIAQ